jgi:hypothetical protein
MEHFFFAVIPAQAGIQGLQELRDPRFRSLFMGVVYWTLCAFRRPFKCSQNSELTAVQ